MGPGGTRCLSCHGFPASYEQRVLAQCLRSPGRAWASHRTAAWLHTLLPHPPEDITVTTVGQLQTGARAHIHRASKMPACDISEVRSVPCLGIERTLIDLAVDASEVELEYALDEALVTRRTSLPKIEWRLRRIGGQGTPGTASLRRCVEARKRLGNIDSQLERRFLVSSVAPRCLCRGCNSRSRSAREPCSPTSPIPSTTSSSR